MSDRFDAKAFLSSLTHLPGVYRMIGAEEQTLYVGKAKDLKNRVASYFRSSGQSARIRSMIRQIERIDVTVTHTEVEALLLENNLIKELHPRYNVLLRDDKSYPYIHVSTQHAYPRLSLHRGARSAQGRYFGPYPSAGAVRETLNLLQKLFLVRPCEDSFFAHRSRPCLQHQIKRCTAPCVGAISEAVYGADISHAIQFLEGKSEVLIDELISAMEAASQALEYEKAAGLRDQIDSLRQVAARQYMSTDAGDVDIIACAIIAGIACVQVFSIRGGLNLGNKSFFPKCPEDMQESALLTSFMGQYYLTRQVPLEIIVSHLPDDSAVLQEMLSLRRGRKVQISANVRAERARWLDLARRNVDHALQSRSATRSSMRERLEALQEALDLQELPARMECFDISHTRGEATVASCVVFGEEGPIKSDYRRFNIEGITPGDDYAAMRQALTRRYTRLKKGEGKLPDILFIDGGKGQLSEARAVLQELQVDGVLLVGVAKGEGRKPGLERLILSDQPAATILPPDSSALHLIQHIRDEAHRFAITGHRQRRAKARTVSPLEHIPGLGPKRRQQLLKRFGGLRGVSGAGVEDLAKVSGISRRLAQDIYNHFHNDGAV